MGYPCMKIHWLWIIFPAKPSETMGKLLIFFYVFHWGNPRVTHLPNVRTIPTEPRAVYQNKVGKQIETTRAPWQKKAWQRGNGVTTLESMKHKLKNNQCTQEWGILIWPRGLTITHIKDISKYIYISWLEWVSWLLQPRIIGKHMVFWRETDLYSIYVYTYPFVIAYVSMHIYICSAYHIWKGENKTTCGATCWHLHNMFWVPLLVRIKCQHQWCAQCPMQHWSTHMIHQHWQVHPSNYSLVN